VSQSELEIDGERVQRLVLARLLVKVKKPLSLSKLNAAVASAISPPLSAAAAKSAAIRAIEQCQKAGHITSVGAPVLTAAGSSAATATFGTKALGSIKSWGRAQQLAALSSIGRPINKALDADALAACVLADHYGFPASTRSAAQAVDRMAWRALGLDSDARFSVRAVQRHLLRELVPADARVTQDTWRRMLAMRAIGASGHDAKALTTALLCRPAKQRIAAPPPIIQQQIGNDNQATSRPQPSLADFAKAVQEAAARPEVTRFHDDRAFIGSVWERMRGRDPVGDMSLAAFKNQLVAAHRQRLLRITRADLVGAMDPAEVLRSEARYQDATFHFVALDAGALR
jgi:hypothetical protein